MIYTAVYESPLGSINLAEKDGKLISLRIKGQKSNLIDLKNDEKTVEKETPLLIKTKKWLDSYFKGEKPKVDELEIELDKIEGSEFRKAVWKRLSEIPYGETTTYGEIAKEIAEIFGKEKMSAQAIGGAIGQNQISIIIPCHRVVGKNGNLTGYAGGINIKIKLLLHECAYKDSFFVPKE